MIHQIRVLGSLNRSFAKSNLSVALLQVWRSLRQQFLVPLDRSRADLRNALEAAGTTNNMRDLRRLQPIYREVNLLQGDIAFMADLLLDEMIHQDHIAVTLDNKRPPVLLQRNSGAFIERQQLILSVLNSENNAAEAADRRYRRRFEGLVEDIAVDDATSHNGTTTDEDSADT